MDTEVPIKRRRGRPPKKPRFEPEYCTISEAARILCCDRALVRAHIRAGYLKLYRLPLQKVPRLRLDEVRRLALPVEIIGRQPDPLTLQVIGGASPPATADQGGGLRRPLPGQGDADGRGMA